MFYIARLGFVLDDHFDRLSLVFDQHVVDRADARWANLPPCVLGEHNEAMSTVARKANR